MHYTAKFFRDNMPEWKRRKDPPLSRVFYRKIAFHCAAFAANRGITANQVSYFSLYVGIVASLLFLFNKPLAIAGAILVNFWLVLDCTDGNLARSVKSQPFGEFADGISSYVLVGMICTTMGFYVYQNGGLLIPTGTPWIILAGAFASSSDTMMRLIYQKYTRTEQEMAEQGKITVLDADGEALRLGLEACPDYIKPNRRELAGLCDTTEAALADENEVIRHATDVVEKYGTTVLCTMDEHGSLYVGKDGVWRVGVAKYPLRGFSGAGDTYLAAFLYARYASDADIPTALSFAARASAAKIALDGTQLPTKEQINAVPKVEVVKL
jgi:phosphatidylglycerophosphate synthase